MAFYLSGLGKINSSIIVDIVTWTDGTDDQICNMINQADEGNLDLYEYWSIGDERIVTIEAINKSGTNDYGTWSVFESQQSQNIVMVLMDTDHYTLSTNSNKKCNYVVGTKNSLNSRGWMNSTATNTGSWHESTRRQWCNSGFRGSLPNTFLPIFKQFNVITAQTYNGTINKLSADYFALFAEKEVDQNASYPYSNVTEANALSQISYYLTAENRIKRSNGSLKRWLLRSPDRSSSSSFCDVTSSGAVSTTLAYSTTAANAEGIAPFGCI